MPAQALPLIDEADLGLSINDEDGEFSLQIDFAQIDQVKTTYGDDTFVALAVLYIQKTCRRYDLADDEELWVATIMNHLRSRSAT